MGAGNAHSYNFSLITYNELYFLMKIFQTPKILNPSQDHLSQKLSSQTLTEYQSLNSMYPPLNSMYPRYQKDCL